MFEGTVEIMDVLKLTVLSMTVVFASLFAISLILELFKIVFYDRDIKKKEKQKSETKKIESVSQTTESVTETDVDLEDKNMLAILFTAAIAASSGKHASNLKIKSIKKVS
ncbi:OadG family protein [Oceanirhabdus sp. W0125-5]|uniref:OadG family protein n=1 Tax=Oceanirhabdus sp. W0125-5 TaxID=2999116 RepID=UPI0022F34849|nr:OadG family protein [Oceanirhabdus sp. W0125-5]WBW97091.1 OadG family protein [Oceanirhabdus sp. W0125-5]